MKCVIVSVLTLLPVGAAYGQTTPQELTATWTRAVPPQIEWVVAANRQTLVVCTSRGELLMLGADTGSAPYTESVPAEPGVQLANGANEEVVYAFDRFSAYALALPGEPSPVHARSALLWQAGEWPVPARTYQGDPEFLTGIVAAHTSQFGLALARSDGRVALLEREKGRVRWQFDLPKLDDARLHVRAESAALLFKHRDNVKAVFLDLNHKPLDPPIRTIGETRPIFSDLLPGGRLLAVWPRRATVIRPEGRQCAFEPESDYSFRAAALDVYVPGDDATGRDLLLASYAAHDGVMRVHAHDLSNGRVIWQTECDAPPDALLTSLHIQGGQVLVTSRRTLGVYEAATGRELATYDSEQASSLLGATVGEEFAYGLYRKTGLNTALAPKTSFTLVRVRLRRDGQEAQHQPAVNDVAAFRIGLAETPQHIVWTSRTLILTQAERLQAYALP